MTIRHFGGDIIPQFFHSGAALALGGRIDFFENKTNIAKNVFTDSSVQTILGSIINLDAAGRIDVWLDGPYRVRFLNNEGGLEWELDDVNLHPLTELNIYPEVVSGENTSTVVTGAGANVVVVPTLTLTDVRVGDRLEYHYWLSHIKGAAGLTTMHAVSGGTSIILWGHETAGQTTPANESKFQEFNEVSYFSGIHRRGICTVAGTYTVSSTINSAVSNGQVPPGAAQVWLGIVGVRA